MVNLEIHQKDTFVLALIGNDFIGGKEINTTF